MNSLESNCLKDCFQDSACQEVILQATVQTCDEKAFPGSQCNVLLGNRRHTVKRNSRISINTLAGGTSPDFANLQANGGLNRNHNQSSLTMTCRNIGDVSEKLQGGGCDTGSGAGVPIHRKISGEGGDHANS